MRRFEGKHVIVTGGARGIGKATVRRFAAEGATVVLTDRDGEVAEATARQVAWPRPGRLPQRPGGSFTRSEVTSRSRPTMSPRFSLRSRKWAGSTCW